jgi:hypothetical protein
MVQAGRTFEPARFAKALAAYRESLANPALGGHQ